MPCYLGVIGGVRSAYKGIWRRARNAIREDRCGCRSRWCAFEDIVGAFGRRPDGWLSRCKAGVRGGWRYTYIMEIFLLLLVTPVS